MADCLQKAARDPYNRKDEQKNLADAREHMDKFLKEHPNHPRAIDALVVMAGFMTDKATKSLAAARDPQVSKENKAAALAAARQALKEAKPTLEKAVKMFHDRLATPSGKRLTAKDKKEREQLEDQWIDARFKVDLLRLLHGANLRGRRGSAAEGIAAKRLEGLRRYFPAQSRPGLRTAGPHVAGEVRIGIGQYGTGRDILDEVLAWDQKGDSREQLSPELESLLIQARRYHLQIVKTKSLRKFVDEAEELRSRYKHMKPAEKLRQAEGYQEIFLDLAKTYLDQTKKPNGSKWRPKALEILKEMKPIPSSSQEEAIRMLRTMGGDVTAPQTPEEMLSDGNAAMDEKHFDEALRLFELAVEKTDAKRKPKLLKAAKESAAVALYEIAIQQFGQKKLPECAATLEILIKKYGDTPAAPAASALLISVLANQYRDIPEDQANEKKKTEAFDHLVKKVNETTDRWPDKPEADDAKMILAEVYFIKKDFPKALKEFDLVSSQSNRYPTALYRLARIHVTLYLQEKQKEEGQKTAAMRADWVAAVKALEESIALLEKDSERAAAGATPRRKAHGGGPLS